MIIFTHVPKTAGSSFQNMIEKSKNKEEVYSFIRDINKWDILLYNFAKDISK